MPDLEEAGPTEERRLLWLIPMAILGAFLLDLVLSLYVWDAWPPDYWMYKGYAMTGVFLWSVPAATLMEGGFIWWPWQPFVWLTAWAAGAGVAWWGRGIHPVNRWLYAGLTTLVLSGFAASEWSTIGD